MDCRDFESRLETLTAAALPPAERRACAEHLAGCPECRELLALASLTPVPPAPADEAWLAEVMVRTSGSACVRAQRVLGDFVDGGLPAAEGEAVASHLAECGDCATLAATLRVLARELPRMAELRPDERFVGDVLARTLPVPVRMRRFWSRNWPRWVRRPRFASEVAYVGALVLVLVFATPGSPLEAVPRRALDTVRTDPRRALATPMAVVGNRLEDAATRWETGRGRSAATGWYAAGEDALERARFTASVVEQKIGTSWGTFRGEVASLLGKAESSAAEPANPTEEK